VRGHNRQLRREGEFGVSLGIFGMDLRLQLTYFGICLCFILFFSSAGVAIQVSNL
jgi:hypothetical protein